MLENILTDNIAKAVNMLKLDDLTEIRIRVDKPVMVGYKNTYYFLGLSGLCNESNAIMANRDTIKEIILKASNFSVYAVNDELKDGYISVKNGIRVGIAGTVVLQNYQVLTTKDISSLNIRIPHQISGSSLKILKYMYSNNHDLLNTLIVGAPGTGKTTILRDLCVQITKNDREKNILLLDERFEISGSCQGQAQMNVGLSTDIICGGKKEKNILNGIRAMSPNIIVLDEIGGIEDINAVEYAMNCGVVIIASIHAKDIEEIKKKMEFSNFIKSKSFKRYVILSSKNGRGTIEDVYDENFRQVVEFL